MLLSNFFVLITDEICLILFMYLMLYLHVNFIWLEASHTCIYNIKVIKTTIVICFLYLYVNLPGSWNMSSSSLNFNDMIKSNNQIRKIGVNFKLLCMLHLINIYFHSCTTLFLYFLCRILFLFCLWQIYFLSLMLYFISKIILPNSMKEK